MVRYHSTRDIKTATQAILQGLSEDGGLFVPDSIPPLPYTISDMTSMSYQDIAKAVFKEYLSDFTDEEIEYCVDSAYDEKFSDDSIVPLSQVDGDYYMELYHGKTMAFKDIALSILPYFMKVSAKKNGIKDEIVILTATSGDTGKAALSGFSDVEGTRIIVFYPKDGVSDIQKDQMIKEPGKNTYVFGIDGNFDEAQSGVKEIFSDAVLKEKLKKEGFILSSANSINFGRLLPQIVYYINSYVSLVSFGRIKDGDEVNVCVPTGNFGNILASFYAKLMGLPIGKLVVASNENHVLSDFFKSGEYDLNREFFVTNSPSMDILVSSNLERLIFHALLGSTSQTKKYMEELSSDGKYKLPFLSMEELSDFYADYATEEETVEVIKDIYERTSYLIDTHTAVASKVVRKYKESHKDDERVFLIASTASPFKFSDTVSKAIGIKEEECDPYNLCEKLSSYTHFEVPKPICELKEMKVVHKTTCKKEEMKEVVLNSLIK